MWTDLRLVWDLGMAIPAILGVASVGLATTVAAVLLQGRGLGLRASASGVLALASFWGLCVGYESLGSRTESFHLVRRGDGARLATVHRAKTNSGGQCRVRVFDLDGHYIGGTEVDSDCDVELAGGRVAIPTRAGLLADRDVVLVDLWTGQQVMWLSELVQETHRLVEVTPTAALVEFPDGRVHSAPWPTGSETSAAPAPRAPKRLDSDARFEAHQLDGACNELVFVAHRSVAFGEGSDLLSGADRLEADARWTVDLSAAWGEAQLLGVVEQSGRCLAVGGTWGGKLAVLPLPI